MESGAKISECGLYRYLLWRKWDDDKPTAMFIMLNPSTADGVEDDPTIRRCISFAKDGGYGKLWVCNLFAYRATKFKKVKLVNDPIGPLNDSYICRQANAASVVICAWGNYGTYLNRSSVIVRQLQSWNVTPYCLGVNKSGEPKHPLYLKKDIQLCRLLWIPGNLRLNKSC